jgi:hypothetical protein
VSCGIGLLICLYLHKYSRTSGSLSASRYKKSILDRPIIFAKPAGFCVIIGQYKMMKKGITWLPAILLVGDIVDKL